VKLVALLLAGLALAAPATVHTGRSSAMFVAASADPGQSFTSAADFNTVAVAMTDPGTPLHGTVSLAATAASDRGIASVAFQVTQNGGVTWTPACTATSSPYSCSWDTTGVADGLVDLRAVALDNAGYSRTASVSARRVDNTAPATTLTDPGSPLKGTVSLSGTGSDGGSGLASVAVQYRTSPSGTWTTICASASCSWATTGVTDGLYDLRVAATDAAGNVGTTVVTSRRVDNTAPSVTVTDPGAAVGGTVTLQTTASDSGSGVASVKYEYRTSPSGAWTTACTAASSPFSCTWTTTALTDGLYDLRATATDAAGNATISAVVSARWVDNTAPSTPTLTNPGSPLSGTVTVSGTATDSGSGVASVRFQYAPAGTTTWTDACSDATTPYSCSWVTTGLTDGLYDMRALATDNAGNTKASATTTNRRVDNNAPTVSVTDPGSPLRGTVSLTATAADGGGISSVVMQYRTSPAGTWTTICTTATSPYTCSWNTTALTDGNYDLQAIATDNASRSTTSAVLATRKVDNTAPTAVDVQSANGGTAGTIDAGDTLTFTYSEAMAPASILAGWTGTSTAVTVRLTNSANKDLLSVWNAANTTRLGLTSATQDLQLNQGWVSSNPVLNATMVQSGSSIVVTIGTVRSGSVDTGVNKAGAMTWTPATAATDVAGNACTATAVTETGALDVDF
jgi:Bacterial Ig domain/Bacterial Ig-like domain